MRDLDWHRRVTLSLEDVMIEPADEPRCQCGHAKNAHEHYRPGSECALCDEGVCDQFRLAPHGAASHGDRVVPSTHAVPILGDVPSRGY